MCSCAKTCTESSLPTIKNSTNGSSAESSKNRISIFINRKSTKRGSLRPLAQTMTGRTQTGELWRPSLWGPLMTWTMPCTTCTNTGTPRDLRASTIGGDVECYWATAWSRLRSMPCAPRVLRNWQLHLLVLSMMVSWISETSTTIPCWITWSNGSIKHFTDIGQNIYWKTFNY